MSFKILQITNRMPYPLNDGGNIAVFNLAKQLQSIGCVVDLAALNTNKHFVLKEDLEPFYNVVYEVPINTDIKVTGILKGFFESLPYNITRFKSEDFKQLLKQLLVLNTYDFIFIEGSYMGLYVDFIKKHTPAKVVLRSHNVEYTIWERLAASLTNPLKKWYIQTLIQKIKKFEIQTLPKYDIVVPITDVDAAFYKSNGANNCITICAGVDIDSSEIPYEDTNQNICFIGSMEWMPNVQGVDWFLEHVWPLIQKQNTNCTFHIAGKGMDQRFNRWKQNGIVLHGQVADAKEFILKNGIFIVPLLSGGGMRLKVVEAMGFRKPIVTTTIGAEGIQVVHKQNCMLSDTAEDFAASILHLIANKEFAKDIADSAYNTVKDNYNWSALANKLYKHLQSIQ